MKLIVLLRDPVARAYSHYHYERHRGFETEPIEVAIGLEDERLAGEEERIRAEPGYVSAAHRHHSYLARGLYFEQIRRVYALFPERQVLILPSERLYTQPEAAMRQVLGFLGLQPAGAMRFDPVKAVRYDPITPSVRERLAEYYAEPNRRLFEYLNVAYPSWTQPGHSLSA